LPSEEILNYFELQIDKATTEGLYRKPKVISQRTYGFRAAETFSLALYNGLGNLSMPELTHKFL
jgi:transposase